MVFDFLEIKEAMFGMFCFFYFGIVDPRPILLLGILAFLVFIWPPFREKIPRGFLLHKINRFSVLKIPNCFGFNGSSKLRV